MVGTGKLLLADRLKAQQFDGITKNSQPILHHRLRLVRRWR